MKDQFADYKTSTMLKELGFNEICFSLVDENDGIYPLSIRDHANLKFQQDISFQGKSRCVPSPLWHQAKQALWTEFNLSLTVRMVGKKYTYEIFNIAKNSFVEYGVKYDSPIEAEIDGIKSAVEYLYKKLKSKQ